MEQGRTGWQPVVAAKIYAEGGGEGPLYDTLFRQAWTEFFKAAGLTGRMPRPVRGKGRGQTFDMFRTAISNPREGEIPFLLVDSEAPVAARHTVWQHLKAHDNWDRPTGASDDQAFLMVQVMETWLIADSAMLHQYFRSGFQDKAIKKWPMLESVPKATIFETLAKATADCAKQYAKGKVSYELLGRLNPQLVENACPNAKRLLDRLRTL